MPGLLERIADSVYREYDRRIKRASLITEYGVAHHRHHAEDEGSEDIAIVNLPLGAMVADHAPDAAEGHAEQLEIEPLVSDVAPVETSAEAVEADIVNAPPGAPLPRE